MEVDAVGLEADRRERLANEDRHVLTRPRGQGQKAAHANPRLQIMQGRSAVRPEALSFLHQQDIRRDLIDQLDLGSGAAIIALVASGEQGVVGQGAQGDGIAHRFSSWASNTRLA